MDYLTVGHVSGGIAAAVATLQFVIPNALILILVACLSDHHSAVTWSVVGRSIVSSHWPMFLKSDTAASQHVSFRVNVITWMKPLMLFLIAIAAVVTPMGLYDTVIVSDEVHYVDFQYATDNGSLGLGTAPRDPLGFSRYCNPPYGCPGSTIILYPDPTDPTGGYEKAPDLDFRIPETLANLYQSGLQQQKNTVSSFFDIHYRIYDHATMQSINNATYLVDDYRPLTSFVLEENIQVVEGLIIDSTSSPKIGFRNHTIPMTTQYGAEWEEDILFIEPETSCVNMNLTYENRVMAEGELFQSYTSGWLVDQGGFVNINKTSPWLDGWWNDGQNTPALQDRAYRAGWTTNNLMLYVFNISKPFTNRTAYMNSEIGARYAVNNSYPSTSMRQLTLTEKFEDLVKSSIPSAFKSLNGTLTLTWPNATYNYSTYWPNPFEISWENFSSYTDGTIQELSQGVLGGDKINMTNIMVKVGMIIGTPEQMNGTKGSVIIEKNTLWSRPLYTCASSAKASIKTVKFRFNETANVTPGLKGLSVISITDKEYKSKDEMPLWGVEHANMSIGAGYGLWGLISPDKQDAVNLSTIRAPHLYIPGGRGMTSNGISTTGMDYMPATSGVHWFWSMVYNDFQEYGNSGFSPIDYTGAKSIALYRKWEELSRTPEGTAAILNRIFIDHAANGMVGTKSQLSKVDELPPNLLSKRDSGSPQPGQVAVYPFKHRVRYRWVFGIPAIICFAISTAICTAALLSIISGKGSISRIRHYLWNLSSGRILGTYVYPGAVDVNSDTKPWLLSVGQKSITILKSRPYIGNSQTSSYEKVAQDETQYIGGSAVSKGSFVHQQTDYSPQPVMMMQNLSPPQNQHPYPSHAFPPPPQPYQAK